MNSQDSENDKSAAEWRSAGIDADAMHALSEGIPSSKLWSLLMSVIRRRASKRTVADLTQQWSNDRFVAPSYMDARVQLDLDRQLFAVATAFESIELAPVAPLGACSVIAPGSQNRIVSTVRGTEVVSDPTNVMALESARRLRLDSSSIVKLAASHRCVRAQALPPGKGMAAHFRLFCLTSAGHETKDQGFVVAALVEHIQYHLDAYQHLHRHGYAFHDVSVLLHAAPSHAHLAQRIAAQLDDVSIKHQALQGSYYDGLRFTVSARTEQGDEIMLSDGGAFDWVAKLASNNKLVMVASAFGSQRAALVFRAGTISTSR